VRWEHGARGDLRRVTAHPDELVVGVHACGSLTDRVLDAALAARAAVAVLPCCHGGALEARDTAGLEAWMEGSLAVDAVRALRLRSAGYRVYPQTIPQAITPENRLLIGVPVPTTTPAGPSGAAPPGTPSRPTADGEAPRPPPSRPPSALPPHHAVHRAPLRPSRHCPPDDRAGVATSRSCPSGSSASVASSFRRSVGARRRAGPPTTAWVRPRPAPPSTCWPGR
jgi:hypothetical protein